MKSSIGGGPHLQVSLGRGHRHSLDALLEVVALLVGEAFRRSDEEGGIEETEDVTDLVDVPDVSPATE